MKLKTKLTLGLALAVFVRAYDDREKKTDDMKIMVEDCMCDTTKKVVEDFNTMTDKMFRLKYHCGKRKYYARVRKYGDPYMNAPLAKLGKFLGKKQL